jgi:formate dehydrogenase major subunit
MPTDLGSDALGAIDKLLRDRPEKVGHDFSEATRLLCTWRDCLIERWRHAQAENHRRDLERVNAAISVVVGGQFPLGGVPWLAIEKVRDDIATLTSSLG